MTNTLGPFLLALPSLSPGDKDLIPLKTRRHLGRMWNHHTKGGVWGPKGTLKIIKHLIEYEILSLTHVLFTHNKTWLNPAGKGIQPTWKYVTSRSWHSLTLSPKPLAFCHLPVLITLISSLHVLLNSSVSISPSWVRSTNVVSWSGVLGDSMQACSFSCNLPILFLTSPPSPFLISAIKGKGLRNVSELEMHCCMSHVQIKPRWEWHVMWKAEPGGQYWLGHWLQQWEVMTWLTQGNQTPTHVVVRMGWISCSPPEFPCRQSRPLISFPKLFSHYS